jgi:beta-galactosidase
LKTRICALALAALISCFGLHAQSSSASHSFAVVNGKFNLDGKPFQIISGEMHYPRIPRAYWRARLKMAKAMGLNTITTYVFWNAHELEPGKYDFSGQNDVAEFIREAQQEGLYVLLRPGPYVCAEWEFGGYPAWLLKDHATVVRSSDPKFMDPAKRWLHRLGQELAPLQLANGGPILMVQVENEYGSFGDHHAYMEQIKQALIDSGFNKSVLYTADGAEQLPKGSLPELPAVINFGGGEAKDSFAALHKMRPDGPFMSGEYWAGWFDHWGAKHESTDGAQQNAELGWMLGQGYSVSIYMFHGGTSFGWMNGANWSKDEYEPDVNSYDYDAVLNESGRPTAKYYAFRNTIAKVTGTQASAIPAVPGTQSIAPITLDASASLWDNLPKPVVSHDLKSMEDLDQAYGYILYRTIAPVDSHGTLKLTDLHDYAVIYVDGKEMGTLDRRLKQSTLPLTIAKGQRLDILVENAGRINYGQQIRGERKGITQSATIDDKPLYDWKIYPLPMSGVADYTYRKMSCKAPCFYRGTFAATTAGTASADTFLDSKNLHKGFVWVNGHALSRTWDIGPQRTLYLPGAWLKKDANDIFVFDLQGVEHPVIETSATAILDAPVKAEVAVKTP